MLDLAACSRVGPPAACVQGARALLENYCVGRLEGQFQEEQVGAGAHCNATMFAFWVDRRGHVLEGRGLSCGWRGSWRRSRWVGPHCCGAVWWTAWGGVTALRPWDQAPSGPIHQLGYVLEVVLSLTNPCPCFVAGGPVQPGG